MIAITKIGKCEIECVKLPCDVYSFIYYGGKKCNFVTALVMKETGVLTSFVLAPFVMALLSMFDVR